MLNKATLDQWTASLQDPVKEQGPYDVSNILRLLQQLERRAESQTSDDSSSEDEDENVGIKPTGVDNSAFAEPPTAFQYKLLHWRDSFSAASQLSCPLESGTSQPLLAGLTSEDHAHRARAQSGVQPRHSQELNPTCDRESSGSQPHIEESNAGGHLLSLPEAASALSEDSRVRTWSMASNTYVSASRQRTISEVTSIHLPRGADGQRSIWLRPEDAGRSFQQIVVPKVCSQPQAETLPDGQCFRLAAVGRSKSVSHWLDCHHNLPSRLSTPSLSTSGGLPGKFPGPSNLPLPGRSFSLSSTGQGQVGLERRAASGSRPTPFPAARAHKNSQL